MHDGELEVINSGSVLHNLNNKTLKFTVDDGNESLHFLMEFVDDPTEKPNILKTNLISPTELKFTYYNHDSGFGGTGSKEPFELGTLSNRRLLLSFYVQGSKGTPVKIINYTWYIEAKIDAIS